MLRSVILWKLGSVERDIGGSLEYLRHVARTSLGAFLKFAKVMPLAEYRKTLPHDAGAVARLVASRDADCGECVQITVNLSKKDGVPVDVIRAVLEERPDDLPEPLGDVYRFTDAVVRATYDEGPIRERLRKHYGEQGLIELAFAIATCRIFPVTKRALGYAESCSVFRPTV